MEQYKVRPSEPGISHSYKNKLKKGERKLLKQLIIKLLNKIGNIERINEEWWTGRDLNPGPLGCQPSALPG